MIRRALVATAAAAMMALTLPLTANAQNIYVLAGASIPSSDYGDEAIGGADTGWLGAAGVTFPVGEAGLWAGAEGLYGRNGISDLDENYTLFSVMGLIGYDIPTESTVSPFVFGGLGLMGLSSSFDDSETETGFGWQLGGGVAFAGESNVTPFVEGRYQSASLGEGDLDMTVSIFAIEAGVSIGIGN